jgi:hypothetical protein
MNQIEAPVDPFGALRRPCEDFRSSGVGVANHGTLRMAGAATIHHSDVGPASLGGGPSSALRSYPMKTGRYRLPA